MSLWADGDALRSADGVPDDAARNLRSFGPPDGEATDIPVAGTSIGAGELMVLGLIGLLVMLAAGLTVVVARQPE
jgi:hypothetical protein